MHSLPKAFIAKSNRMWQLNRYTPKKEERERMVLGGYDEPLSRWMHSNMQKYINYTYSK